MLPGVNFFWDNFLFIYKPITLSKSVEDHFSEKYFQTSNKNPQIYYFSVASITLQKFNRNYNWISWKFFFEEMVLVRFKEFPGLHDDLKIIWKKLTPGLLRGQFWRYFLFWDEFLFSHRSIQGHLPIYFLDLHFLFILGSFLR